MKCIDKDKIDVGAGPRACPDFTKGNHRGLPRQKDLLEGWVIKPIGEACQFEKGKKPKNTGNCSDARTIPYINIKAFESGVPEEYAEPGNYPICSKDDVLIVWDGARSGLVGKGVSGYIGSTLSKIWSESTDDKYLFYFLKSQYGYVNTNTKGVGIPHVDPNILYAIQLPLAPFNEQKLIVSEIEKQFSCLDEAVASLKRVRAGLKRYKVSVLKAAVEGRLTEEWRENQISDLTQDKRLKDNKLPIGWIWKKVSDLGDVVTGTTPTKARKEYYDSKDYPFFKPTDLNEGYYVKKSEDGLSKEGIEKARLLPTKSILVTCIGATIGKTGLIRVSGAFNQQINAIIPQKDVLPEFVYFVCISPQFQKSIIDNASATTLPILNKRKFEMLTMPMPPLIEQQKIVSEIESRLSVAEEIEEAIDINLKRAERLRQAILKKAFSGRLV